MAKTKISVVNRLRYACDKCRGLILANLPYPYRNHCLECSRGYLRPYYLKNKKHILRKNTKWHKDNPEKRKVIQKRYQVKTNYWSKRYWGPVWEEAKILTELKRELTRNKRRENE